MLMNDWTEKKFSNFSQIILGLPVPEGIPVACNWTISANLRTLGYVVDEIHNIDTLHVELIRNDFYLAVIHADLLKLDAVNNAHRAFLINLAKRFENCGYRIWDPEKKWGKDSSSTANLEVWTSSLTLDIENLIRSQIQVWN